MALPKRVRSSELLFSSHSIQPEDAAECLICHRSESLADWRRFVGSCFPSDERTAFFVAQRFSASRAERFVASSIATLWREAQESRVSSADPADGCGSA